MLQVVTIILASITVCLIATAQALIISWGWAHLAPTLGLPEISVAQAVIVIMLARVVCGFRFRSKNEEVDPKATLYSLVTHGLVCGMIYLASLFL